MKFFRAVAVSAFIFLLAASACAQSADPLFNRLCKSWSLIKLEDNGQVLPSDEAQSDYRMVFNKDSTVLQGLAPNGFIQSKWQLHEKDMLIIIRDLRTNSTYRLKIIKLTNQELILQNLDDSKSLVIYYKAA